MCDHCRVSTSQKKTRGQAAYEALRTEIIGGGIAPGRSLRIAALAEQYGASFAVVREALLRLAGENLVVLSPNQGFRVAELSLTALREITDVRVLVECEALRLSVDAGGVEWESRVIATHHGLSRAVQLDEQGMISPEWQHAHGAFHDALGSACANERLRGLAGELRDNAELYRQLSVKSEKAATRDVAAEHRQLMELAIARQADKAVAALEQHLRTTTELLIEAHFAD